MAVRIVGVDLPQNKRGEIALTYIYGIGRSAAKDILSKAGARISWPFSSSTRNIALDNASTTVPSCSIAACFAIGAKK